MEKLTKNDISVIENQMFNKARDIDVCVFNYVLGGFPQDLVLDALSMYQNRDGGFGHALDPNNLNPNSTVYETLVALGYLYIADFKNYKDNEVHEQMLNKVFNYLYNKKPDWSLYDETNLKFAASVQFQEENNLIFPKNMIVAYTLYYLDEKKPYYKKALAMLNDLEKHLLSSNSLTNDEILGYKFLYEVLNNKNISYNDEALAYLDKFTKLELNDINAYYIALFNKDNDEALDMIIKLRKNHGLWETPYEWGNNYPEAESAKLKMLGATTLKYIHILKKYNRIMEI